MKHKLFFCFLLFFIIIFNFISFVFANNEIKFNYNGESYSFNEPFDISDLGYNYSSYFAYYNGTKYFLRAYLSNSSFVVSMKNGSPSISTQDSSDFAEVIFQGGSDSFTGLISSVDTISYHFGATTSSNYAPGSIKTVEDFVSSFVYSPCGVYDVDGNLLFQHPPALVIIPEITQAEEIPQMMGEVMKILIPVGLIIFGIGLVILLIRLVISRVT